MHEHGYKAPSRAHHGLFLVGVVGLCLAGCAGLKSDLRDGTDPLPARADIVRDAPDTRPLWKRALRPAWVARSPRWVQVLWYSGPGH